LRVQKVGECFGSSLDDEMARFFSQLDNHQSNLNRQVTQLGSTVSTGNKTIHDLHQTTASRIDSLVEANTALQPRLELIDRLHDVPLTEDITSLHDLLSNQVHQGQQNDWAQYDVRLNWCWCRDRWSDMG
jgi:glycine cleavage system protein P-like pyridoxal-binding family